MKRLIRLPLQVVFVLALTTVTVSAAERPIVTPQLGHSTSIRAFAFSHDSRLVASGDVGGNLRIWQTDSGRELLALKTPHGISSLAFSRDGTRLAVGHYDGVVTIWVVRSGVSAGTLRPPRELTSRIMALAFSAGDEELLSYSRTLARWRLTDGKLVEDRDLTRGWLDERARFSGDGSLLIVASRQVDKREVRAVVFDTRGGQPLMTIPSNPADVAGTRQSFSVFAAHGKRIVRWDSATPTREREIWTDTSHWERLDGVTSSPDGMHLIVYRGLELVVLRAADGTVVSTLRAIGAAEYVNASNTHVVTVSHLGCSCVFDVYRLAGIESDRRAVSFGQTAAAVLSAQFVGSGGNQIATFTHSGYAADVNHKALFGRLSTFAPEGARMLFSGTVPDGFNALNRFAMLPTGEMIAGFGHGALHFVHFTRDGKLKGQMLRRPEGSTASAAGVGLLLSCPTAVSLDGALAARADPDGTITIWDLTVSGELRTITRYRGMKTTFDWTPNCTIQALAFSARGDSLLVSNNSNLMLEALDPRTGLVNRAIEVPHPPGTLASNAAVRSIAISPDDKIAAVSTETSTMLLTLHDLKVVRHMGDGSGSSLVRFSRDGHSVVTAMRDHGIRAWPVAGATAPQEFVGHRDRVVDFAFDETGRLLVSAAHDGTTIIWDLQRAVELARLVVFLDGEWLVITPEGYFNASSKGPQQINFRIGDRLYPLNQFYDAFYRPDIVERKLRGEDIAGLISQTLEEALKNPPPHVSFAGEANTSLGERVRVRYRVESSGGGIGDVRVFHNGKLVQADAPERIPPTAPPALAAVTPDTITRGLLAATSANRPKLEKPVSKKPDLVDGEVIVEAVPGENEIAVIAYNRTNSVQSEPVTRRFSAALRTVTSRLHVVAVGIDEYGERPLKFAVKDAVDFAGMLRAAAGATFADANISLTTITNAAATRDGLIAALDEVAKAARPWDTFVLFVASHGTLHDGAYAMVTHDFGRAAGASGLMHASELLEASRRIPALNQIMILDTCHAGGLNSLARGLYDARMAVLARGSGTHIFASAAESQEAIDGFQDNGLYTHALLAALRDPATDRNKDRQVSVLELGQRSREIAIEVARRIKFSQTPAIMSFGKDQLLYQLP